MVTVIIATQYTLCGLSMLLTGLFCIQVSSASSISEPTQLYSMAAMLIVGIGFDLSKYIFWYFRDQSTGYLINCLALVVFSWSASVAFFISHEQSGIEAARLESESYKAHQIDIKSIKAHIQQKTTILESRINSQFHDQWDKAEALADSIQQLKALLKQRVRELDSVGHTEANENTVLVTTSLFQYLALLLNIPVKTVSVTVYAILAFLIESCSLGIISLSASKRNKPAGLSVKRQRPTPKNSSVNNQNIASIQEKQQQLRDDIASGKTDPILRKLRKANYKLSEKNIREVLLAMKEQGLLIDGPRSLKLAPKNS